MGQIGSKLEVVSKFRAPMNGGQSGIGLPHSTTLTRGIASHSFREVVECGSPMPLLLLQSASTFPFIGAILRQFRIFEELRLLTAAATP